jgi:hypothetical protein
LKRSALSHFRTAATSFGLAALLTSAVFIPVGIQPMAREYKVQYKITKTGYRSVRMLGNSAYICVPSGFGQKGGCYPRERT